ncbi:MAG: hypothetical protein ACR2NR_23945 [Solirubrobacteraceae bacterium]
MDGKRKPSKVLLISLSFLPTRWRVKDMPAGSATVRVSSFAARLPSVTVKPTATRPVRRPEMLVLLSLGRVAAPPAEEPVPPLPEPPRLPEPLPLEAPLLALAVQSATVKGLDTLAV